jgi:hypothetical protein
MNKVAILYICTGKYDVFWKEFYESYEENFLKNSHKEYFVFTDAQSLMYEDKCDRIHKIFQKQLGWPYDTLMRFSMFDSISQQLMKFDYVFFMNANCKCVSEITEDEFLPKKKDILVVQHPGEYNKKPSRYSYDRNPKSTAYIPKGEGKYYICGGINGGRTNAYLELVAELKQNVDTDLQNNVIAKWHDESHINHYIYVHDNWEMLSPSYCYAEDWNLPFEPKILVREKSNYIDANGMKFGRAVSALRKIARKILR